IETTFKEPTTFVVDKVVSTTINECKFMFTPFVYPGKFIEALNTYDGSWQDSNCIFAHQEFFGCKMGGIISVEGDKWPLDYPEVVSGHIHSNQRPQQNIYYPGSALQHAFGDSSKNIIAHLKFTKNEGYQVDEIDLQLPRKKIVYMDIENLNDYIVPNTTDKIKITVSGGYEQFKALKKTNKYKALIQDGIKVIFKPIKLILDEKEITEKDVTTFSSILDDIVNKSKDNYLFQTYELVVNNKKVDIGDFIYL
ncbi:MAG: hypothetical protein WCG32_05885, partial [Actinomycetes bacterium]